LLVFRKKGYIDLIYVKIGAGQEIYYYLRNYFRGERIKWWGGRSEVHGIYPCGGMAATFFFTSPKMVEDKFFLSSGNILCKVYLINKYCIYSAQPTDPVIHALTRASLAASHPAQARAHFAVQVIMLNSY
jgi:hypothetical protein